MTDVRTDTGAAAISIAIVGMAGRFPGARDCTQFWNNLAAGAEAISFFSHDQLRAAGVPEATLTDPDYVPARGVLDGAWCFDAAFFGYSPAETQTLDPQHRTFLECAWEALESAGYATPQANRRVGVWGGAGFSAYHTRLFARGQSQGGADDVELALGSEKGFLSTRVSYKLGLRGPAMDVQSACSTSLVAVALASQSLLCYQCDLALAGGVSVVVPQRTGYRYQPEMIYSPDGHCRAFDMRALGCVPGNGVAVVALKRLGDAVHDGDEILAVIRGFATNNDGSHKPGFTAPSSIGQAEVIAEALEMAGPRDGRTRA
jgi:phthiocerol/phenolphthiocerol synthesis type-I polyketide synthase E